jgi:hypothetical protein
VGFIGLRNKLLKIGGFSVKNYITVVIILLTILAITIAIVNEIENLKYEVHLLQKIVGGE